MRFFGSSLLIVAVLIAVSQGELLSVLQDLVNGLLTGGVSDFATWIQTITTLTPAALYSIQSLLKLSAKNCNGGQFYQNGKCVVPAGKPCGLTTPPCVANAACTGSLFSPYSCQCGGTYIQENGLCFANWTQTCSATSNCDSGFICVGGKCSCPPEMVLNGSIPNVNVDPCTGFKSATLGGCQCRPGSYLGPSGTCLPDAFSIPDSSGYPTCPEKTVGTTLTATPSCVFPCPSSGTCNCSNETYYDAGSNSCVPCGGSIYDRSVKAFKCQYSSQTCDAATQMCADPGDCNGPLTYLYYGVICGPYWASITGPSGVRTCPGKFIPTTATLPNFFPACVIPCPSSGNCTCPGATFLDPASNSCIPCGESEYDDGARAFVCIDPTKQCAHSSEECQ